MVDLSGGFGDGEGFSGYDGTGFGSGFVFGAGQGVDIGTDRGHGYGYSHGNLYGNGGGDGCVGGVFYPDYMLIRDADA
jgi:hypothetical protein